MTRLPFQNVTIVGAGLLGCSLGLALRAAGFGGRIIGVARRQATLDTARARGGIDHGTRDLAEACDGADLVVLATPVGTVLTQIDELAALDVHNAVVTDVGSTKRSIVERAAGRLGRFVGSHPMAGGEMTGPEAARADLYTGKPCIITPTDTTDGEALAAVEQLWTTLGMRLRRMAPAEHDKTVAVISHWPHVVSVLLMEAAASAEALDVASTGLADMTRLAGGDVTMWSDILLDNAEAVCEAIEEFSLASSALMKVLRAGSREELQTLLADARRTRQDWRPEAPGEHA